LYKIERIGKGNITARIVADSLAYNHSTNEMDSRVTTFEIEYPRFILAELNTHRMFSRNSASSRAIPVKKMIGLVEQNTAMPIIWNKNQKGMQSHIEFGVNTDELGMVVDPIDDDAYSPAEAWYKARDSAISYAKAFDESDHHKQTVNRLIEPFQMMKTIVTSTDFDNFFNLRFQSFENYDAQHEIHELAKLMYECYNDNTPVVLNEGDWHTPYYKNGYYAIDDGSTDTLEDALKISCSCCAQVSYRLLNDTIEKAIDLYNILVESDPVHASAFEHCATPITPNNVNNVAVTHMKRVFKYDDEGNVSVEPYVVYGSGNFDNWIQYRQTIPNHVCHDFKLKG